MFSLLNSPSRVRKKLLNRVGEGALREYLEVPLPMPHQHIIDTEFLALDFETTGLDAGKDRILSIGFTLIRNGRVVLAENGHYLVKDNQQIPVKNTAFHNITDERLREGIPLHRIIPLLLKRLAGRVILVHCARVEKDFLDAACQKLYGHKLPVLVSDTLRLERRKRERRQQPITSTELRLHNLRKQYGLPRYPAHHALEDAIATAELFLAQCTEADGGKPLSLRDVLFY